MTSMVALTAPAQAMGWGTIEEGLWEVYMQPEIRRSCFCHVLLDRTSYLATPIAREPGKCSAAKGPRVWRGEQLLVDSRPSGLQISQASSHMEKRSPHLEGDDPD